MPKTELSEIIISYPFDEGKQAKLDGKDIHSNPYKAPNRPKTDDVKSDAWLRGFDRRQA